MCLNAITPPVQLTQDLTVYKVIRENNTSFAYGFQYQPNTYYGTNEKLPESSKIDVAFHSYLNFARACGQIQARYCDDMKVVTFIIPKGTWMVFGNNGEIASAAIRSYSLNACPRIRCVVA